MPLTRDLSWQNVKIAAHVNRKDSTSKAAPSQEADADLDRSASAASNEDRQRQLQQHSGGSNNSSGSQLEVPGLAVTPASAAASTSTYVQSTSSSSPEPPLALLRVQVTRARNLVAKDRNGKSDPFVTVSIPGLAALASNKSNGNSSNSSNSSKFRKQTSVAHKTLNPEWQNETWDFEITDEWFGPGGWQQQQQQGEDGMTAVAGPSGTATPTEDRIVVTEEVAEALNNLEVDPETTIAAVATGSSLAPSRPSYSRKLSSTASKVLSTSAKGVMLLPKGAAAGARAVARGTPRPMNLRRGTAGRRNSSNLNDSTTGLAPNLEIVVWDKDFARREYLGEANWPVWQWCRSKKRTVEWDHSQGDAQATWLTLVSSRRNANVSGQVQIRIGLVPVKGSPVKNLDALYRSLVAQALGATGNRVVANAAHLHTSADADEDEIRAGVRAIPASQSVGTTDRYFEDDGFSSNDDDDEEQEFLDSETDDEDDEDEDSSSETESDARYHTGSGEDDSSADEEGEEGGLGFMARHKERLRTHNAGAASQKCHTPPQDSLPAAPTANAHPVASSKRKLFSKLGRKSRSNKSSVQLEAATGDGLLKSKGMRRRRRRRRNDVSLEYIEGETKEQRKARRKQARQVQREQRRATKRERRAQQQEYSFKAGGDIVGIVMMEVQGAKDLPRWKNSIRTGFDMDPFTIVAFGQKVFRTRVLRHTLNPKWDEKLLFHVRPHEEKFVIQMSIYDWDKLTANDHVGSCELPLATLLDAAPQPDPQTGLYDPSRSDLNDLQTFNLPLSRSSKDEDVKYGDSTPHLTFRAKYTPYAALRQRFWRQLCQQFDTDDTDTLSFLELTSMLDSLGSTLTTYTINSFFTRHEKNPETDDLTYDQAIIALEEETKKPFEEKRRIRANTGAFEGSDSVAQTPAAIATPSGSYMDVKSSSSSSAALDISGPSTAVERRRSEKSLVPAGGKHVADGAANEASVGPATESTALVHMLSTSPDTALRGSTLSLPSSTKEYSPSSSAVSRKSSGLLPAIRRTATASSTNSGTQTPERSSSTDPFDDDPRPVERVILLKSCPLCHMPRLSKKGDGDVVTHLAVCASQDWRRVDQMVVSNFVTASQAHRKWLNKAVIKATQGKYSLGANSANILVQDRETGELLEEKMQIYVRLGIRLLYQGARSRMEGARVRKMLKNMSVKQGKKYDSPSSAREIPGFVAFHNLNVDEIREPLDSFKTFNQFFYRKLKEDARPVSEPTNPKRLVSAADCRLMVFESIDRATSIWIKGREFSVERLLGDAYKGQVSQDYLEGSLCIFRLAPQDYHRFHCPVDGIIGEHTSTGMAYFTVNPLAIRSTIDVYCDNVRVVVPIHTEELGTVYTVNIGAMLVASVVITAKPGTRVKRGDELGYYAFGGSTTVCVFPKGKVQWDEDILRNSEASIETLVKQGTGIGRAVAASPFASPGEEKGMFVED